MTAQPIAEPTNFIAVLQQILVESAGVPSEVFHDGRPATLQDLGLDSLATMEVQAIVGTRFGITLPDEIEKMTVAELSNFMVSAVGGKG